VKKAKERRLRLAFTVEGARSHPHL
jgi:hypothetical protein